MANLRIVRIPLLERVILEQLADQWQVSVDEALAQLIRQAARQQVIQHLPNGRDDLRPDEEVQHD